MHSGADYWRPIWEGKDKEPKSDAVFSGRSTYTRYHRMALLTDATVGLELSAADSLLDVGCASGFTGYSLARVVRRYVGLDYSGPALQFFNRNRHATATLVHGSAMSLPFADASFDKVYMGSVLLCLSKGEVERALAEIRRVTRKRAMIADTMFGQVGPCVDRDEPVCTCLAHQTAFHPDEFHAALVRAGWIRINFVPMHYSLPHAQMGMDTLLWV